MNNNHPYQLNCPHCGSYITFNIPENKSITNDTSMVFSDENIGNISISNSYKNSGSFGTYEAMDVEMICPHCSYSFKSTVHSNSALE